MKFKCRPIDFDRIRDGIQSKFRNSYAESLYSLGREAVTIAINDGNYLNRTGALRSSIGCGVFIDGTLYKEYGFFSFGSEAGSSIGRALLMEAGSRNYRPNTIKLIVVAGASYAKFVEEKSGYTVLRTGEDFIRDNIGSILRQLKVISE